MELVKIQKKLFGLIKIKKSIKLKKVYFCGIQIYKKYLNRYYQEDGYRIDSIYSNIGFTNELNQKLELIFQSFDTCINYDNKIWLIYLHSLIEQGRIEDAELFLNRYVYYFGQVDFEAILLIAKFVYDRGYKSDVIKRSAEIYDHITKNILNKNIFEGKTIAVVGNSGCELGKNKGKEIDSHNIVIRFNSYPEDKKWLNDYGSKTNIWIRNISPDAKQKNDMDRFDYIIQHENIIHRTLDKKNLDLIYKTYSCVKDKYFVVPDELRFELAKKSGIYRPTSGCTILWTLYKLLGSLKGVDVYGFSFLSKDYTDIKHYFDNICKIDINHDMKLEIDLLHKLYFEEEGK